MNEPTVRKLRELCLLGMVDAFQSQEDNPAHFDAMPFEDRFAAIVDAECDKRKTNKLNRLIKAARLRYPDASPAGFDYSEKREVNRSAIAQLFECRFLEQGRDAVITGVTGTGKTWLACAIGKAACRKYKTVRYVRLPSLLADFAQARDAGRFERVLAKYAHYELLIIDDWLLFRCGATERRDIYELVEARDEQYSTIYCSQFSEDGWMGQLGRAASAEGVIARITKADVIRISFSSKADMRAQRSLLLESQAEE